MAHAQIEEKLNKEITHFLQQSAMKGLLTEKKRKITYEDFLEDKMLIVAAIRAGIPYTIFNLIRDYTPFTENDWAGFLDISTKSLQRYKTSPDHQFKPIHSEKIIEIAEVTKLGLDVFGEMDKFKLWLNTPNFALGRMKPIELLKDSYGKEMIIGELTRIDYGILA